MALAVIGARAISRAPDPVPVTDEVAIGVLIAAEAVAVVLAIRLWRERGRSFAAKLFWTFVTLVPVLGLLAYAAWRDPPPPAGPTDRSPRRDWE